MKQLLTSILFLISGFALAHPGHEAGNLRVDVWNWDYLIALLTLVVVCRILYVIARNRDVD